MRPMRLLIFGAGVLGTFYAAKLQARGNDVTVLARGHRAVQVGTMARRPRSANSTAAPPSRSGCSRLRCRRPGTVHWSFARPHGRRRPRESIRLGAAESLCRILRRQAVSTKGHDMKRFVLVVVASILAIVAATVSCDKLKPPAPPLPVPKTEPAPPVPQVTAPKEQAPGSSAVR